MSDRKSAVVLRGPQVRILEALSKSNKPLSRAEIAKKAKTDLAGLTEQIGSSDPARRKANDKKHFPSLLTLGYLKEGQDKETNAVLYVITASGRKALEGSAK